MADSVGEVTVVIPSAPEAHAAPAEPPKRRYSCWWYACQTAVGFSLAGTVIGVGIAFAPPDLQLSLDSFVEADVPSSVISRGFSLAKDQQDASADISRRLGQKIITVKTFGLLYDAGSRPIVTVENLRAIAEFEFALRSLPHIQRLCSEGTVERVIGCRNGISLANIAFPARQTSPVVNDSIVPEFLRLDGTGRKPLPLSWALDMVEIMGFTSILFPASVAPASATSIRSMYFFELICCDFSDRDTMVQPFLSRAQKDWKAMLTEDLLPSVRKDKLSLTMKETGIKVYVVGQGVSEIIILDTIQKDLLLALGSFAFVFLYVLLYTRSFLLSVIGLAVVFLSIPLAYVTFAAMSGTNEVSIAFLLSGFLMCGIGSDVMFVYNDVWAESLKRGNNDTDRLCWTYRQAVKTTLASSLTTSLSFFANLASIIKPLREFGLFMGLCVFFVFLLMPITFAPACVLEERRRNEQTCFGRRSMDGDETDTRDSGREGPAEPSRFAKLRSLVVDLFCNTLQRWRWSLFVVPAFILIASLIPSLNMLEVSTASPPLFADDHEESRKIVLEKMFSVEDDTDDFGRESLSVCGVDAFNQCQLHWCEAKGPRDESSCSISSAQRGVHDLRSQKAMEEAGWTLRLEENSFRLGPNSSVGFENYSSTSSFWGHRGNMVLEVLGGPGFFDLTFSNIANMGMVEVFMDGVLLAVARLPHEPIRVSKFFSNDFVLVINATSGVVGIHGFSISCAQHDNTCRCRRRNSNCSSPSKLYRTVKRFVGLDSITNGYAVRPVMMEQWFEGTEVLMPVQEVSQTDLASSPQCDVHEICFCNTSGLTCELGVEWVGETLIPLAGVDSIRVRRLEDQQESLWEKFPLSQQELGNVGCARVFGDGDGCPLSHRRLEWTPFGPAKVHVTRRGHVTVVFGITVFNRPPFIGKSNPSDMWAFNDDIALDNPWTQRLMRNSCVNLPASLRVVGQRCWIESFRDSVERYGRIFPMHPASFKSLISSWSAQLIVDDLNPSTSIAASSLLWFRDGVLRASFMNFRVDFDSGSPEDDIEAYMELWDAYLGSINGPRMFGHPPIAFHTSNMWIRCEVAQALLSSTGITLALIVVSGFLCMVLFTRSIVLSLYVAIESLLVICGVLFFIVVITRVAFGPTVVIGLIVFLGYSVTFSLHVAHHYGQEVAASEAAPTCRAEKLARRAQRARFAVETIGGVVLGSAVTTVGSSFFMLFCTLQIFQSFGSVSMVVATLSAFTAMVHLLAGLVACGPTTPGCSSGRSILVAEPEHALPHEAFEIPQLPSSVPTRGPCAMPMDGVKPKFQL
eukprot:TRINITY_DN26681_c0_g1_i1.p1 TRINITY_DN26681_c0_g1~~TRINITY_DN26681_c0_g1_i1.p1  ORF type:complete len:1328 (-),score=143.38 TRINITY_DN26681_c0_g1_i1:40-3963(-)